MIYRLLTPVLIFCLSQNSSLSQDFSHIKDEATLLGSTSQWCSFEGEYSTTEQTSQQPTSSCYQKPFNYGKWFKFQAVSSSAEIKLKVAGDEGTMQWPRLSLWNENIQEIECKEFIDDVTDISMNYTSFQVGKWYYISVNHNNMASYAGSFILCVNSELSNDFIDGAEFISNTTNWTSAKAEYTTVGATNDGKKPSCMADGPNFNRWFQFIAKTNSISIEVQSGDDLGAIKNPYLALFDAEMNEISCDKYVDNVECKIEATNLKANEKYFFSVDHAANETYKGTFTLSVNDGSAKEENVLLKITDFATTDLIKITGKLLYNTNSPKKNGKIWLLNDKDIKVDSTTTDTKGEFNFKNLPPDQNFLVMIEEDLKDIKVNIFQTDYSGSIIKKTVRLDKQKYGFEDLPAQCNKIILVDCKSTFDVKIEQGRTGVIGKVVERDIPIYGMPSIGVSLYSADRKEVAKTKTDSNGEFEFTNLPPNVNYQIKLDANTNEVYAEMLMLDDNGNAFMSANSNNMTKDGFFRFEKLPYITEHELNLIMEDDIELTDFTNLEKGKSVKIHNVYFEIGKSTLLSRSYRELDRFAESLNSNNNIKVEVQGHTDNTGSDEKNMKLSEDRAKEVVNYLISKGVDKSRISYKGYGSTKPVGDNSTEDGRKKNRRVEFMVVE